MQNAIVFSTIIFNIVIELAAVGSLHSQ